MNLKEAKVKLKLIEKTAELFWKDYWKELDLARRPYGMDAVQELANLNSEWNYLMGFINALEELNGKESK